MSPLSPQKAENIKVDVYEERQKSLLTNNFYSISQKSGDSGDSGDTENIAAPLLRKEKVVNSCERENYRYIEDILNEEAEKTPDTDSRSLLWRSLLREAACVIANLLEKQGGKIE